MKAKIQHIAILCLGLLMSSCFAPMEIFEAEAPDDGRPHIGSYYSTSIYEENISDEVWVSPEPNCIQLKVQSDHVYSGETALHVSWDKGAGSCDWIGIGFGWDGWAGKNMGAIYDRAAIRFRVRTDGRPTKNIPMALALESYGDASAWVGFSRKMIQGEEIGPEWTDVIIPILAFNWKEMDADITNVKQLMMEFQASGDIYLDNIEVIEYDGSLRSRGLIQVIEDEESNDSASEVDHRPFEMEGNEVFISMDEENLYIDATVIDETPLQNSMSGDEIWNGDAIEIAFSTDSDAPLGRNFYLSTDRHFGIKASKDPIVWDWRKNQAIENCQIKVESTGTGYTLNASIPREVLGLTEYENRAIYGIEIALDLGDNEARQQQLRWNSPDVEGFHSNPSLWGEARIVKN